ncbi:cation transporter [Lysobacter concretionis Ko07 = DSM 16239]|uniref:Cation transporter n=1 Tax=Lysobacter concretionis Ko07 = DSM 16239 TaxID=1122185 RepID=A0A0A0EKK3_9GAMM|nr:MULTISPECIES: TolC family protein [Lysobacter]KGM50698.1 cation transporter [Lysobacter concretionis Ko07 = DSM 16239]QOD90023.1 TolC family protein [Lysobacter sp. CW239]
MRLRLAALAALVVVCAVAFPAHAADPLTLDDAFQRVANTHPNLRLFGARRDVLAAELDRVSLRPALVAGTSIENAFGTGAASGLDGAEITLSLASVLERGGKLDARRTLAQSRIDALAVERETQRLDLLAEVARRYLAVVAAQQQTAITQFDIEQRERTVAEARKRLQAGASPESVVLTAQAALARAELDHARAQQRETAARQHLAALWGERAPSFEVAGGDPLVLPEVADFAVLADWLARTPELAQFVGAARIREARLQLARSEATPDLDWQVGVRRLQGSDDFGLIGSVSIPLGSTSRAQPAIRAARAELAGLEIEREAKGLSLYSTLAEAHGRYRVAEVEVERLQNDVLPRLTKAEAATRAAYRAGAASYLEWATLQAERTAARKQQLEAALDAQRALIEIQRLTGQAFVAGTGSNTEQGVSP